MSAPETSMEVVEIHTELLQGLQPAANSDRDNDHVLARPANSRIARLVSFAQPDVEPGEPWLHGQFELPRDLHNGRRRIVEATKNRWAAMRAAKTEQAKAVGKKVARKTAAKKAPAKPRGTVENRPMRDTSKPANGR